MHRKHREKGTKMAAHKRINISIDEHILASIDATAKIYGMSRSECIEFAFKMHTIMHTWDVLEEVWHEEEREYQLPSKYELEMAAWDCEVTRK